jgi:hypothetical protein
MFARLHSDSYIYIYIYIHAIHHLGWWSLTQKWLTKMSAIHDFCQPFQIANIFWSGMTDQNHEWLAFWSAIFEWVIITQVMNSATLCILAVKFMFYSFGQAGFSWSACQCCRNFLCSDSMCTSVPCCKDMQPKVSNIYLCSMLKFSLSYDGGLKI